MSCGCAKQGTPAAPPGVSGAHTTGQRQRGLAPALVDAINQARLIVMNLAAAGDDRAAPAFRRLSDFETQQLYPLLAQNGLIDQARLSRWLAAHRLIGRLIDIAIQTRAQAAWQQAVWALQQHYAEEE